MTRKLIEHLTNISVQVDKAYEAATNALPSSLIDFQVSIAVTTTIQIFTCTICGLLREKGPFDANYNFEICVEIEKNVVLLANLLLLQVKAMALRLPFRVGVESIHRS